MSDEVFRHLKKERYRSSYKREIGLFERVGVDYFPQTIPTRDGSRVPLLDANEKQIAYWCERSTQKREPNHRAVKSSGAMLALHEKWSKKLGRELLTREVIELEAESQKNKSRSAGA